MPIFQSLDTYLLLMDCMGGSANFEQARGVGRFGYVLAEFNCYISRAAVEKLAGRENSGKAHSALPLFGFSGGDV